MNRILSKLEQSLVYVYRFFVLLRLLYDTYRHWPIKQFLDFWLFNRRNEIIIGLKDIKLTIRNNNIFSKISDLYVAYEAIVYNDQIFNTLNLEKSTVLDVGSNIGTFSLAIARKFHSVDIIAFEPAKSNYLQQQKNIALNPRYGNIKLLNLALANGKKVRLYLDKIPSCCSLHKKTNKSVVVDAVSLSEVFRQFNIVKSGLVKLDCEGTEYEVIYNTPVNILERTDKILIEYHEPCFTGTSNPRYNSRHLIKYLKSINFKCTIIRSNLYLGLILAERLE